MSAIGLASASQSSSCWALSSASLLIWSVSTFGLFSFSWCVSPPLLASRRLCLCGQKPPTFQGLIPPWVSPHPPLAVSRPLLLPPPLFLPFASTST